jgi:hypothetical protein
MNSRLQRLLLMPTVWTQGGASTVLVYLVWPASCSHESPDCGVGSQHFLRGEGGGFLGQHHAIPEYLKIKSTSVADPEANPDHDP